ncbi:hypothetical protein BLNAU_3459 [Blattamonas nauphoetae]|uniref:Uncharacterized protein n=1 Tax=Blattamonas nauphoetae TaxID=2049346 RepID=A0ABQ9YD26_9EUKA|nr:hypothetical protein BLNAU_3459 [Blattamonas nauphoetae]
MGCAPHFNPSTATHDVFECISLYITTVASPPRTEGSLERAKMWPAKPSLCLRASKRHGSNQTRPTLWRSSIDLVIE